MSRDIVWLAERGEGWDFHLTRTKSDALLSRSWCVLCLIPTLPDADYISHAARPQSVYVLFQRPLSLMPTELDASPPTARMYFDALWSDADRF
jgi:hypothetical protein